MMTRMIATKSMRYGTRRLRAGDPFDVKPRDVRILLAVKKAMRAEDREVGTLPAPPASLTKKMSPDAAEKTKLLRTRYESVLGKRPYNGWDDEELIKRIKEAEMQRPGPDGAQQTNETPSGEHAQVAGAETDAQ